MKTTSEKELDTCLVLLIEDAIRHEGHWLYSSVYDAEEARSKFDVDGCEVSFQMRLDGKAEHAIVQGKLRDLLNGPFEVRYELAEIGIALDILENDSNEAVRDCVKRTMEYTKQGWSFKWMDKIAVLNMTAQPIPNFSYNIPVVSGPYWEILHLCKVLNQAFKEYNKQNPNYPLESVINWHESDLRNRIENAKISQGRCIISLFLDGAILGGFMRELRILASKGVFCSEQVFNVSFMSILQACTHDASEVIDCNIEDDMKTFDSEDNQN